jgi:hypothetical protein
MFKEFRDTNAEAMAAVAKTIRPTTNTKYHAAEATVPNHPMSKSGPLTRQFFDPPSGVRNLNTEQLVDAMADGQRGGAAERFKQSLAALYPDFPELQQMPLPKVGNLFSRPLDYMDTSGGGYPAPAKALAVALENNATAKALQKAATSNDPTDLVEYRKRIVALMPPEVRKHFEEALASA